MKFIKIIVIILTTMILLWMINFTVDFVRYLNGQTPLLSFHKIEYSYDDGHVTAYQSLGYQVVKYERKFVHQLTFNLGYHKPLEGYHDNYEVSDETGDMCPSAFYYFYEDEVYKYYFTCLKSIYIKFDNGVKLDISDALNGQFISIETLSTKGLDFKREEK